MLGRNYFRDIIFNKRFISIGNPNKFSQIYESALNLKNIYPTSSLDITKPISIPSNNDGNFSGYIPMDKMKISYCRSSGPGGQHVNKVNTKVDLRFHLESATWLEGNIKSELLDRYRTRINKDGFFIIKSERTRSQQLNLADAVDKLRFMIRTATVITTPPSYKDLEIRRRRQEKSTRERLRKKHDRSLVKSNRQDLD